MWTALLLTSALAADPHEPDDRATAQASAPVYHVIGQAPIELRDLVAEPGGEDWFHVYVDCCNAVGAWVAWQGAVPGGVKVAMYDANGVRVPAADLQIQQGPGFRRVRRANTGGDYYIRVWQDTASPVRYSVRLLAPVYL